MIVAEDETYEPGSGSSQGLRDSTKWLIGGICIVILIACIIGGKSYYDYYQDKKLTQMGKETQYNDDIFRNGE
jgi:hypothetical protein